LLRREKRGILKCKGTTSVTIKTRHGKFTVPLQRVSRAGEARRYFDLTGPFQDGEVSQRLHEVSPDDSNRMSDEEVEKWIERLSGERLRSDQKIWEMVVEKAVGVSQQLAAEVEVITGAVAMPGVNPVVDLYDPTPTEMLVFDEALQVNEQQQTREPLAATVGVPATASRVSTDVML
jgi:hypothetical protein